MEPVQSAGQELTDTISSPDAARATLNGFASKVAEAKAGRARGNGGPARPPEWIEQAASLYSAAFGTGVQCFPYSPTRREAGAGLHNPAPAGLGLLPETRRLPCRLGTGMAGQDLFKAALVGDSRPWPPDAYATSSSRRSARYLVYDAAPARLLKTVSRKTPRKISAPLCFLFTCRANSVLGD